MTKNEEIAENIIEELTYYFNEKMYYNTLEEDGTLAKHPTTAYTRVKEKIVNILNKENDSKL